MAEYGFMMLDAAPLLVLVAAAVTPPPPAPPERQAVVPGFAADGFVQKKIDGTRGVYVEALSGRWYYLKVMGECPRLDDGNGIGINTSAGGQLDRYASLTVDGRICLLSSVTETPPPPPGGRS